MSVIGPRFSMNGDGKHAHPDERKRQVIDDLSGRFSELNRLWAEAEAELRKIPLPVDASVRYSSIDAYPEDFPGGGGPQIRAYLGFVKSDGGWRICHCTSHDEYPEYGRDWKPITECSLDLRLQLIPHLAKLRDEVLREAEECVPRLDKAIADFRSALASW